MVGWETDLNIKYHVWAITASFALSFILVRDDALSADLLFVTSLLETSTSACTIVSSTASNSWRKNYQWVFRVFISKCCNHGKRINIHWMSASLVFFAFILRWSCNVEAWGWANERMQRKVGLYGNCFDCLLENCNFVCIIISMIK